MLALPLHPHRSFHQLPFSNGLVSAKVNLETDRVDSFREHIYSYHDEFTPTRDFCRSLFFGSGISAPPRMAVPEYIPGTGIVRYAARNERGGFEACVFAPMISAGRKIYYLVSMRGPLPASFGFAAEFGFTTEDQIHSSDNLVVIKSGPSDEFITLKLFAEKPSIQGNYARGFLEITSRDPDCAWFGLSVTFSQGSPDCSTEEKPPAKLLAEEEAWWAAWHAREKKPVFKSREEQALFAMSTTVLKMAQCREPGGAHGQILASLPPGHWNICWIRDAAYAVSGLILANHLDEARSALVFFLEARCGTYRSFISGGRDFGVGLPYRISVCRYYGNGTEESDGAHDPNIELDGFGLFLWVLERYIDAARDMEFARHYANVIFREISDVIVHCIEPELRIIRAESGPWERHIVENGYNGSRRYSYTSATAHRGLVASARLAGRLGRTDDVRRYRAAAEMLRAGFQSAFIAADGGYIKGLHEESNVETCLDAGAVEGINFDLVSDDVARATLRVFDRYLKMKRTPGYARNDDGAEYDRQEWVVIDLRIASAFARLGERSRYEELIDWVTAQSARNFNLIGELYSVEKADYSGAIPMCGFGPGAYITALNDREKVQIDDVPHLVSRERNRVFDLVTS